LTTFAATPIKPESSAKAAKTLILLFKTL